MRQFLVVLQIIVYLTKPQLGGLMRAPVGGRSPRVRRAVPAPVKVH